MSAILEEALQQLAAERLVKHAVLGVESVDGQLSWIGAAGSAQPDGTPMGARTPYFIASITKLYIAAALLKLQEQGVLSTGDLLCAHLPHSLIGQLHRYRGVDFTGELTLQHLLSHTSGLPDWIVDRPRGRSSLLEGIAAESDRSIDLAQMLEYVRSELEAHFPPQSPGKAKPRVRYSDTNFQLLIGVLEHRLEMPFGQVLRNLILEPLGLENTVLCDPAGGHEPMPATVWAGATPLRIPRLMASFRDLYSTARDQLDFLRGLTQGQLLSDELSLRQMQRWNSFGVPRDLASLQLPGWPIQYGAGMMRFQVPRILTPFKPVPAVIGHTGASGSWLFFCPEKQLFLCGTVDQVAAAPLPFRFLPRLLRALE
ncbi:beta-lactamase family protein [Desulfurispirillum indicum]|uniref:serine hydrolase domain-containing protein n=1 Tax=Desulfurispirillum indicum TaxID=936456 RepID=UPI001CFBCA27|nr:serine hydrolase domain-containing protein [Desulfurispirillum indicum]UCZ56607.1 beta-lactamase family protein [Desulfurispirillum indicum]